MYMIPTRDQIQALWKTHALPPYKQNHCTLVSRVAVWFAGMLLQENAAEFIDIPLLEAASLLHDIDKMAQKLPNEHHPDAGVRILTDAGFSEVANIVRTHPLHAILDQNISPRTWEERLLYLSDKMTKHAIITVDERFALWRQESLPADAVRVLNESYPKVKELEKEICGRIHVRPEDVAALVNKSETSTMRER